MSMLTAVVLLIVAFAAPAVAWEPTRPIELIVPAGTGGGADQMARLIAAIADESKLSPRPVVASEEFGPSRLEPVYLYVPAGQVRRWSRYCDRYDACGRPVYFVRVDNAPFKLGSWKQRSKTAARAAEPAGGADSPF